MADPGFPGQHTTTTTVRTSDTTVETSLRFDPSYIRKLPGMLKIAEMVLSLTGFICIEASGYDSHLTQGEFFNFVAMTAFWITGFLLAFYLFHVVEKLYKMPWLKFEFGYCALWTLLYLFAASFAVSMKTSQFIAAGFFGYCAMVAFGIDTFLKFKAFKSGQLAQGDRVISKQTTTSTSVRSPAY